MNCLSTTPYPDPLPATAQVHRDTETQTKRWWRGCSMVVVTTILLLCMVPVASAQPAQAIPHLQQRDGAVQLIVDGKPFLMRGAELENSTASSPSYLEKLWPKLVAMRLNTVVAPVYWNFIEPREGSFDFSSVDDLIKGARAHDVRLVVLWFGSWKNSMSSYAPGWVKQDSDRFPRARRTDGSPMEILSAFSKANLVADSSAFAALMDHLRKVDGEHRTVVMVQVENEVGMIPEARDHSALANAAFQAPVPAALTDYLSKHRDTLAPQLKAAWRAHGFKVGASWEDTFGASAQTDEFFTAWTEGHYTGEVAASGKAVYPLPLFANAALIRPGKAPGEYPSGGPLPHLFDIWHAAAPAVSFLAPDIYFPNFLEWAKKYARPGVPFFIPETGRVSGAQMGANAFYAYAQLNAMGFSPYAPEFLSPDDAKALGEAYEIIAQLTPLILASQGTGKLVGMLPPTAFDGTVDLSPQTFVLGNYTMTARFEKPGSVSTGAKSDTDSSITHGGLVIQIGPNDFWFAGTGITVSFGTHGEAHSAAGIDSIWEGHFVDDQWVQGRQMNGDDTNQGRYLSLPANEFSIRRVTLYPYH